MLICTHIIQSHFFLSSSSLCLEKYSFSMIALWAWMFFGSWQCWIRYYISNNVCQFTKEKKNTIKEISGDFQMRLAHISLRVCELILSFGLVQKILKRYHFVINIFVYKMILFFLARVTNLSKNCYI